MAFCKVPVTVTIHNIILRFLVLDVYQLHLGETIRLTHIDVEKSHREKQCVFHYLFVIP